LQKEETRIRDEVQEQEAAKQAELTKGRKDAAFLGQMFIETSKDEGEKKCRIAQLMQLRNADCNDESKSAPCQWLRQFKKEIQAKDGDIESCVTVLKNEAIAEGRAAIKNSENNSQAKGSLITENPAAAKIIQKLPPRAYIQIFDERDRERSQDLKGKLQANNFIVPAVENVGDDNGNRAKPLAKNIIRCYNQVDCDKISSISKIVAPDFEVQQIPGNTNFGSIEFWYKAP
jgi:hypothetical protein